MRLIDADALLEQIVHTNNVYVQGRMAYIIDNMPTAYDVEKVVAETENVLQDLNVIEIMSHFEADKTIQKPLENFLSSFKEEIKRIIKNGGN